MKTQIIGGYFCKKLQHWVKVIKPTKNKYKSFLHSRVRHRMIGAERKAAYEPTMKDQLKQEAIKFLIREEAKLETSKERS